MKPFTILSVLVLAVVACQSPAQPALEAPVAADAPLGLTRPQTFVIVPGASQGAEVWARVAQLVNNSFWGLNAAEVASGPNTQTGDDFLTTEPTIQKWHLKP